MRKDEMKKGELLMGRGKGKNKWVNEERKKEKKVNGKTKRDGWMMRKEGKQAMRKE